MDGVGFSPLVASLMFMICNYTFFQSIHALQNHSTPSCSMSSPSTRILKVGFPLTEFPEFVSIEKNGTNFIVGGFCVEVFEAAIKPLNYSVHYIPVGHAKPDNITNYYDYVLHEFVRLKNLDAVVGDIAITSKRSKYVQFAQPFLDSGLVAVVRMKGRHIISFGWVFTKPFTAEMWLLTVGFFISGGIVVYILERKNNLRFQGQPSKQFGNILWFSFSTWFINRDDIRTVLGRIVVVAWLFVIGILYSCYTANLSAILTASRLEPTLNDITDVVSSKLSIGYRQGSPVGDILVNDYGVSRHRVVPLNNEADYYNVFSRGIVGAIVDERPYMQSLVAKHCDRLAFAGQPFTTLNWGFAFDRNDYQLVRDISVRILELSENGDLHILQRKWLPDYDSDCSKYISDKLGSSQLHVEHFWGLFAISGLVSAIVLLIYMVQWKWNSSAVVSPTPPPAEGSSGPTLPPGEGSSGPNPPPEGSSDQGGGGYIPDKDYGGSLEMMKKIQFTRRTKSDGNAMRFNGI